MQHLLATKGRNSSYLLYPCLQLLLTGCLIFLLTACSTGAALSHPHTTSSQSTSAAATKAATQSALPAGTILYQADWSRGISGWQGAQGWRIYQGQLQAAGPTSSLTLPYQPSINNYAIEARIQVASLLKQRGGSFSLFVSRAVGKDGYKAGVSNLMGTGPRPNGSHPQAQIYIDPMGDMDIVSFRPVDYEPGSSWHTYRVEIQNSLASFLIDGSEVGTASSNQTPILSPGPIGLTSNECILRVSSFRISAL